MVVEIAVGQKHVLDADAVGVVASLFLAGQRRYASVLCLQHGYGLTVLIEQQVVSEPCSASASCWRFFAVTPACRCDHSSYLFTRFLFGCH